MRSSSTAFKFVSWVLLQLASAYSMAGQSVATARDKQAVTADGNGVSVEKSPALTGVRRPLYRLRKSDVVEVRFTFSPELDQIATVSPDGYLALRGTNAVLAEGLTLTELQEVVRHGYENDLRDPEITILLKDFEKPFFLAGGQVGHPGKYELRSPTTVAEAISIAGGFTEQAKHSQVVLFRRVTDGVVESRVLNLKSMLAARNLEEDVQLLPGDMLFVPQNRISKIKKFLPVASLSAFLNPGQF